MNLYDPIKISSFISKTNEKDACSLVFSHAENYIENPSKGRLFGLINISCKNFFDSSKSVGILKNFILKDFYDNDGRKVYESLETTLMNLKSELLKLVKANKVELDQKIDLNCILISIKDNIAYFAKIGEVYIDIEREGTIFHMNSYFKDNLNSEIKTFSVILTPTDTIITYENETKQKILGIKFDNCLRTMNFESLYMTPLKNEVGLGIFALKFGTKPKLIPPRVNVNPTINHKSDHLGTDSSSGFIFAANSPISDSDSDLLKFNTKEGFATNLDTSKEVKKEKNVEKGLFFKNHSNEYIAKNFPNADRKVTPEFAEEIFSINYKNRESSKNNRIIREMKNFDISNISNGKKSPTMENLHSDVNQSEELKKQFTHLNKLVISMSQSLQLMFKNIKTQMSNKIKNLNPGEKKHIVSNDVSYRFKNKFKKPNHDLGANDTDELNKRGFLIKNISKQKLLAIVILIILVIFVTNLIIQSNKEKKKQQDLYNDIANLIKLAQDYQKNANSQASLNASRSNDLLTQALKNVENATTKNTLTDSVKRNEINTQLSSLKSLISQTKNKIEKNSIINSSYVLQDLKSNFQNISPIGLEVVNGNIFVADSKGYLYQSNLANIGFKQILEPKLNDILLVNKDLDNNLLIYTSLGMYRLSASLTIEKIDSLSYETVGDITSMKSYDVGSNEYLYTLSRQTGQIRRSLKTGNAYGKLEVRDEQEVFKQGLDLQVDGNVWVLTSQGVKKYFGGKEVTINMPTNMVLPIDTFSKFVLDDSRIIFIDNKNKRVVLMRKDNELDPNKLEYLYSLKFNDKGTEFGNIISITFIDDYLYILDTNKLYKVKFEIPSYI